MYEESANKTVHFKIQKHALWWIPISLTLLCIHNVHDFGLRVIFLVIFSEIATIHTWFQ